MQRTWWVIGLALGLGGCASAVDERVRDYNEDGIHLFTHGRYADARESFQAALTLKPDDIGLLYNLGQCYDRLGAVAQAERHYRECLQQSPNHVPCRYALAGLLVRSGRQPEAARMIDAWLAQEPRLAAAYALDGWLSHQAGDLPRAQARLQQALELDPHDVRALTELARIYEKMERPERALVLYERVLACDPGQTDVVNRLNMLLAQGVQRPQLEE